jgi:hypothetical protein
MYHRIGNTIVKCQRCLWEVSVKIFPKWIKKIIGYFTSTYREVSYVYYIRYVLDTDTSLFLKYLCFIAANTYTYRRINLFGNIPVDSDPTSWSFVSYFGDKESSSLSFSDTMQLYTILLSKHMYQQDLIESTQIISVPSFLQMSMTLQESSQLLL